jgi:hypothetical protein
VPVLVVVPAEERLPKRSGILDAAELATSSLEGIGAKPSSE